MHSSCWRQSSEYKLLKKKNKAKQTNRQHSPVMELRHQKRRQLIICKARKIDSMTDSESAAEKKKGRA